MLGNTTDTKMRLCATLFIHSNTYKRVVIPGMTVEILLSTSALFKTTLIASLVPAWRRSNEVKFISSTSSLEDLIQTLRVLEELIALLLHGNDPDPISHLQADT